MSNFKNFSSNSYLNKTFFLAIPVAERNENQIRAAAEGLQYLHDEADFLASNPFVAKIIFAAKAKGISYEINVDEFGIDLGLKVQDNGYFWYSVYETSMFFKQFYNQNTGKAIKAVMYGLRTYDKVEKALGIKIWTK